MWHVILVDLDKFLYIFAYVREDLRSRLRTFTTNTIVCTSTVWWRALLPKGWVPQILKQVHLWLKNISRGNGSTGLNAVVTLSIAFPNNVQKYGYVGIYEEAGFLCFLLPSGPHTGLTIDLGDSCPLY